MTSKTSFKSPSHHVRMSRLPVSAVGLNLQTLPSTEQRLQYCSLLFGQRCRQRGIAQSMGSKGDCYDNAVCESFHASLEKDLLRRRSLRTRQEARTAVFDYIEAFYNRERLHSTLGYRSPERFERDHERSDDCASGTNEMIFIEEQARAA